MMSIQVSDWVDHKMNINKFSEIINENTSEVIEPRIMQGLLVCLFGFIMVF